MFKNIFVVFAFLFKNIFVILYDTNELKSTSSRDEYFVTDNWYWGYVGPKVGNCSGTIQFGRDATTEIEKYINSRIYIPGAGACL